MKSQTSSRLIDQREVEQRDDSFFLSFGHFNASVCSFSACKLLEISTKQQPTTQLALDMLKRLNSSSEEIIEILLENNFVLEALQFCHEHRTLNRELARKILTAAMKADELLSSTTSNQKIIFFTVYRFFEEFFQRTATIGALAQSPTQNEDDFRTFREHFNSYFQNGNSNLQQS